ncbi:hypothetical protein DOTSEDRAFT_74239 [Dothistroma septosporum NZE10]|uniref:Uncharacterized protein n=1 Tax=Dothistroma septosporum (strain NZE10 / CBS 128990) TaxID=675120 RepID=N1PE44_DOTSN|nr:hypothetical protein DOTSEDRAFT_74239 [Dothistroma septosporum NZE10]
MSRGERHFFAGALMYDTCTNRVVRVLPHEATVPWNHQIPFSRHVGLADDLRGLYQTSGNPFSVFIGDS